MSVKGNALDRLFISEKHPDQLRVFLGFLNSWEALGNSTMSGLVRAIRDLASTAWRHVGGVASVGYSVQYVRCYFQGGCGGGECCGGGG